MEAIAKHTTVITSTALRFLSFIFLRWIPGHPFPPLVITGLLLYIPSFVYLVLQSSPYVIVEDEVSVVTTENFDHDEAVKAVDPRFVDGGDVDDVGEELTVEETIVVERRDPAILRTLLSGLPSPTSLWATATTLAINIALASMVIDYVYRPKYFHQAQDLSFARVGYVSDTTAMILVREPRVEQHPVVARYRVAEPSNSLHDRSVWKHAGQLPMLAIETDYTGHVVLSALKPDTRYEYLLSNNATGHLITAPRTGQVSRRFGRNGNFNFLHSSCLKNNFPYNPFAHPLANTGLRYLSSIIEAVEAQFMLFLGDFIYIDVPKRHGASTVEDYRREYRHIYASPDWPAASRDLPWIHVYDDHEIANDWDKNTTGFFPAAVDPYQHYHTAVNPPAARSRETYFEFTNGPATFFMLDTRRYRSPNDKTNGSDPFTGEPTKSMLGQQQLQDLLAWLKKPEPQGVRWKILVSSVPFTRNWWYGAQDTWRGYLGERQIILEAMWDVGARGGVGVVILSGDRHEFAATAFPPPPGGKRIEPGSGTLATVADRARSILNPGHGPQYKQWPASAVVHEFSASPLNMFYLPIRTYKESSTSPDYTSDVCIKYLPDGNSKVGAVSISSPGTSDQSILHYRLFVDGKETWSYTITTPPDGGNELRNSPVWG